MSDPDVVMKEIREVIEKHFPNSLTEMHSNAYACAALGLMLGSLMASSLVFAGEDVYKQRLERVMRVIDDEARKLHREAQNQANNKLN